MNSWKMIGQLGGRNKRERNILPSFLHCRSTSWREELEGRIVEGDYANLRWKLLHFHNDERVG